MVEHEPPSSYGLAVSASDGATAYFCYPMQIPGGNGVTRAEVWVTHDLAAHWTYVSNLPLLGTGSSVADSCDLDVDTLDSNRLLANFYSATTSSHAVQGFTDWFASTDGGATWTTMQIHQWFTFQRDIYVLCRPWNGRRPYLRGIYHDVPMARRDGNSNGPSQSESAFR